MKVLHGLSNPTSPLPLTMIGPPLTVWSIFSQFFLFPKRGNYSIHTGLQLAFLLTNVSSVSFYVNTCRSRSFFNGCKMFH